MTDIEIRSPGLSIRVHQNVHDSDAQQVLDLVHERKKRQWARNVARALLVAAGVEPHQGRGGGDASENS